MNQYNAIPFHSRYDYRLIKLVRKLRNLTLEQFSKCMKVDTATLSQLENGSLEFSIHYQSKFLEALDSLDISKMEMSSLQTLLEHKKGRN